ncbi:MAG: hypothetical protein NC343_03355 [Muribaculum sp.]|nr:hypothetical protein [Muribaculaceae bacterium]MCM1080764.1 hypothetical protein [Muribaculum sp.]
MIKTVLKILLILTLIAYAATALLWSRARASEKRCTSASVVVSDSAGLRFVTPGEVARDLGKLYSSAPGKPLANLKAYDIISRLNQIDKIENATAVVYTDGSLEINVTPMRPVARIFTDSEPSFYINRQGKRILANPRYHVDVPVISMSQSAAINPERLLPLISFLSENPKWDSLVTHIKVVSPNNVLLVPMIHGHVINLGSPDNLPSKFNRIELAYRRILPVKGWDFYDTISVKWKGQIVATRRIKKLNPIINPAGYEAEREEPDLGTMMTEDTIPQLNKTDKHP